LGLRGPVQFSKDAFIDDCLRGSPIDIDMSNGFRCHVESFMFPNMVVLGDDISDSVFGAGAVPGIIKGSPETLHFAVLLRRIRCRPPWCHTVLAKKTGKCGARELTAVVAFEDAWRRPHLACISEYCSAGFGLPISYQTIVHDET
jgi:hypothetical protein